MTFRLSRIEFGSFLTYSPRGTTDPELRSRTMMRALKDDQVITNLPNPPVLMSDTVCDAIKKDIESLPFSHFFNANTILVPTPRSSLIKTGTLWVPQRFANALKRKGLGRSVEECLQRVTPVRKAAASNAADRPKAADHYDSMLVQKIFPEPEDILLVDDVITRGATLLGATNRLVDAFPNAQIRVFAAMRTISPPDIFRNVRAPCTGTVELKGNDTFRRP